MKDLFGLHLKAVLRLVEQVAVALAKSVVDLDHDGAQCAVGFVAVPEAHGLEGVTQYARVGVQPDLAAGVFNTFTAKQLIDPADGVLPAVAMVRVKKAQQAAPVVRKRPAAVFAH